MSTLLKTHVDWLTRWAIGSSFGIVLTAWIFYVTQYFVQFSIIHGIFVMLIECVISCVLYFYRRNFSSGPKIVSYPVLIIGIVIPTILMTYLFYTGFLSHGYLTKGACYGDLPFHLNLISSFAHGCNSQRKSFYGLVTPFFSGERLAYPFIPNFYSAVLVACFGCSYHMSLVIPSIFYAFSIFTILVRISYIFAPHSQSTACLSVWLFLLMGGLGFTTYRPKEEQFYVDYVNNWPNGRTEYWFQPVIHIMMPQRASLFSLPIAWGVIFLLLLDCQDKSIYVACGLLEAALPQVQAHSIIATAEWGVIFALVTFKSVKKFFNTYFILGCVAILFGIGQISLYLDRTRDGFFKIKPIYKEQAGRNFFTLWLYGLGFFFILSILTFPLFLSKQQIKLYLPSLFVWLISNFVYYQPWHLDNTKVFNAGWVPLACPVVAYSIVKIWSFKRLLVSKALAVFLFLLCVASGCLALRMGITEKYPLWSNIDRPYQIADFVIRNTPTDSIWLTSDAHTHPIVTLAGRQTFVGYKGWLSSHGLDFRAREIAMDTILHGGMNAAKYIKRYNISYFCSTRGDGLTLKNTANWKKIYSLQPYEIYKFVQ